MTTYMQSLDSGREASTVSTLVAAGDLRVGDEMPAADGYLFTVKAIVRRTAKMTTVLIGSDFSPMPEIRAGVEKSFRNASKLRVIRAPAPASDG